MMHILASLLVFTALVVASPTSAQTLASRIGTTCAMGTMMPSGTTAAYAYEITKSLRDKDAANGTALIHAGHVVVIPYATTARVLDADWTKAALGPHPERAGARPGTLDLSRVLQMTPDGPWPDCAASRHQRRCAARRAGRARHHGMAGAGADPRIAAPDQDRRHPRLPGNGEALGPDRRATMTISASSI